jgi:hypothetical protein
MQEMLIIISPALNSFLSRVVVNPQKQSVAPNRMSGFGALEEAGLHQR